MTDFVIKSATATAKAARMGERARKVLADSIKTHGVFTAEQEKEFDRVFVKVYLGLRSDKRLTEMFARGAKRTDAEKAAMALARKTRQRAREDAGVTANDTRGGARNQKPAKQKPAKQKPATAKIPSAVTAKEAAAHLLAYSNKNAKVLPAAVMREIKAFAAKHENV